MENFTTLEAYLYKWAGQDPARRHIAVTLSSLSNAGLEIARLIARGPLAGTFGAEPGRNSDGDGQKALDLLAHDLVVEAIHDAPVAWLISAVLEQALALKKGAPLVVAIDPLDGSSNIDTNVSLGTIFSILPAQKESGDSSGDCPLQAGIRQLAAGYIIYGPRVALVLTLGAGTHIFTLDPYSDQFCLTTRGAEVRPTTHEFAINTANFRNWDGHIRAYVDDCLTGEEGPHEANYTMRWIASLVAECHRILSRGGIFLYPGDERRGYGSGRLRLIYECNPIAMLVEQAGGAASTGQARILEIQPQNIHQRVPMIFGSEKEVRLVGYYYQDMHPFHERSQLFRHRSLLRR